MNYKETISYLCDTLPMFQQKGQAAYHPGLESSIAIEKHLHNPYKKFKTIHVAGTNGKGTCSHTLAAILQSAGYKVGLYTSPHLVDFRERIRVNGEMMDKQYLVDFIEKEKSFFELLTPSFFEVTTALAFSYFADKHVDVAVIEVGLGGRLDCTNVITPEFGIITNISMDHTKILGDTLTQIATEKAGIIKTNIPIIIGETTDETRPVFEKTAEDKHAPIIFAEEEPMIVDMKASKDGGFDYTALSPFAADQNRILVVDNPYVPQSIHSPELINFHGELGGYCQPHNTETLLQAVSLLYKMGYNIYEENLKDGFANVVSLTHLHGRWEPVNIPGCLCPAYCDTGHNPGGMQYIAQQLESQKCDRLHIIIGMVGDKDVRTVLSMLPKSAYYYFTQPSVERALPADKIREIGEELGLKGEKYPDVSHAVEAAIRQAGTNDFIFIGGSGFTVGDLFSSYSLNL